MNRLRVGLALSGFVLALLAIALDDTRLAWGAIALLAGSAIFRLILRKRVGAKSDPEH